MSSPVEAFETLLRNRGLRLTAQRREILAQALARDGHFDAEELHDRLRRKKSRVSKASVYRTLPLLEEAGLLREVEFVDRHTHYEKTVGLDEHAHLICTSCRKVIEFRHPSLERALREVVRKHGFEERSRKVEITGLCSRCRRRRR